MPCYLVSCCIATKHVTAFGQPGLRKSARGVFPRRRRLSGIGPPAPITQPPLIITNDINVGTGVCEKNTPPEKKCGQKSSQSTKSGAGAQFLPLDCRTKAHVKDVFFTDNSIDQ